MDVRELKVGDKARVEFTGEIIRLGKGGWDDTRQEATVRVSWPVMEKNWSGEMKEVQKHMDIAVLVTQVQEVLPEEVPATPIATDR